MPTDKQLGSRLNHVLHHTANTVERKKWVELLKVREMKMKKKAGRVS